MIYPNFLKENDTIGVTAPSDGITKEGKIKRLNFAIQNFAKKGFLIQETSNVRTSIKGKSSDSKTQALELESLFLNPNIKMIFCAAGGDFLLEMLSFINFETIKLNPKWLQGYSDPTGLLYTITTNLYIATIYGDNFAQFGMCPWHKSLEYNLELLKGNITTQGSFLEYESVGHHDYKNGDETYILDKKVCWESLNNEDEIQLEGRIIGGCLDILTEIFGTRFDNTLQFVDKYQQDGIIWYFDNCELSSEGIIRTLWKFKDNGYFNHCKGIIFGRSATETSYYDISFKEAIKYSLKDLNIPIIINADIGHVSPRMTIINGALAEVNYFKNKGSIKFILK